MRQLADVILVGAGTVRAENYSGAQFSPAQRQARQRRGQAEVPPIAVLTNRGALDHDAKLFTRTEVPPLILTSTDAVADATGRLGSVAEVIDASGPHPDRVDAATVLKLLADRSLFRVLVEGGPRILGMLIEHDLLDELCMTIAPLLVGGAPRASPPARPGAHSDAARPPAHRRCGLSVRALRQGVLGRSSVLWFPCVGVAWSVP